jgi:hypothetical protein
VEILMGKVRTLKHDLKTYGDINFELIMSKLSVINMKWREIGQI